MTCADLVPSFAGHPAVSEHAPGAQLPGIRETIILPAPGVAVRAFGRVSLPQDRRAPIRQLERVSGTSNWQCGERLPRRAWRLGAGDAEPYISIVPRCQEAACATRLTLDEAEKVAEYLGVLIRKARKAIDHDHDLRLLVRALSGGFIPLADSRRAWRRRWSPRAGTCHIGPVSQLAGGVARWRQCGYLASVLHGQQVTETGGADLPGAVLEDGDTSQIRDRGLAVLQDRVCDLGLRR